MRCSRVATVLLAGMQYTGPEGHYLVLDADGEGGNMLLFETDGAKVLQFRSGDDSAERAPEGCA